MRLSDYVKKEDSLVSEDPLFEIPVRKEYLLREIGRGKKVLDLGCLGGKISSLIQKQNNEVYGVEMNIQAASQAQARGIKVKVFDLNDGIPFEDGFFDVVNAGEVVEHIYDTKFLFEECNRVLKPKGTFLFTTPNLNSLVNRLRVLKGDYLGNLGAYPEDHFGSHIRVFNVPKIKELCAQTGFQVLEVVGIPALTKETRSYWLLNPVVKFVPQLGELLMVKARRIDQ